MDILSRASRPGDHCILSLTFPGLLVIQKPQDNHGLQGVTNQMVRLIGAPEDIKIGRRVLKHEAHVDVPDRVQTWQTNRGCTRNVCIKLGRFVIDVATATVPKSREATSLACGLSRFEDGPGRTPVPTTSTPPCRLGLAAMQMI
jgi:hypothetical protein